VYENDEKVFEALKAGASGYLLKNTGLVHIIEALKELYQGGSPMSSTIARKLVRAVRDPGPACWDSALSARENEILQLLARGLLYKEISDQLHISTSTVRQHIHRIYEKLHVQNRTEAINKTSSMSTKILGKYKELRFQHCWNLVRNLRLCRRTTMSGLRPVEITFVLLTQDPAERRFALVTPLKKGL
jgi:DNA-binding CsgD family transcriptional regulator